MYFWDDVKKFMKDDGHDYDADDCRKEFKELERKFKDVDAIRKKTGAEAFKKKIPGHEGPEGPEMKCYLKWEHYDMVEFFREDFAVGPARQWLSIP